MLKLLVVCSLVLAQPPGNTDTQRIGELIEKLGSAKFQERNGAQKELEGIGLPALEQLKKSMQSDDLETSRRVGELVRKIEEKKITAEVLAPKNVHLKVTELPAVDAVQELAKLSGYPLQVMGDKSKITGKKITLDTGTVPFWKALDALCAEAGLMEQNPEPSPPQPYVQGAIQIQIQGQPLPIQALLGEQPTTTFTPSALWLFPGKLKKRAVSHAGSVRLRMETQAGKNDGEIRLTLEASAEPRLHGFTIVGNPSVAKALDDQGQKLVINPGPLPDSADARLAAILEMQRPPLPNKVNLNFKAGEKPAKSIKELTGSITAQIIGPKEPVVTLNKILKATGESATGKNGEVLKLNAIESLPNGEYKLQIFMQYASNQPAMGGVFLRNGAIRIRQAQIQGEMFGTQGMPELLDAKGKSLPIVQVPSRRVTVNNGIAMHEVTIHYRVAVDVEEADRLVLFGTRPITFSIPFAFENIPLE